VELDEENWRDRENNLEFAVLETATDFERARNVNLCMNISMRGSSSVAVVAMVTCLGPHEIRQSLVVGMDGLPTQRKA
jgi:hypothetical protein